MCNIKNIHIYIFIYFSLQVYYARPVIAVGVVIYLGSDGRTYDSPEPKSLLVQLIDTDDRVTYVEHKLVASCRSNPIYVSILHDLSRPFFRTKGDYILLSSFSFSTNCLKIIRFEWLKYDVDWKCKPPAKLSSSQKFDSKLLSFFFFFFFFCKLKYFNCVEWRLALSTVSGDSCCLLYDVLQSV